MGDPAKWGALYDRIAFFQQSEPRQNDHFSPLPLKD